MAFVGVAQVLVLDDDHVSIADFFQGAKAQGGDTELSHNHTAATTTKKKKDFTTALNNTQLLKRTFISWDPALVNLRGVFTRNVPLSSSSNDLQILKRTE